MHLWVEPAGGERKSANVEQKMVTLIYPYPFTTKRFQHDILLHKKLKKGDLCCNLVSLSGATTFRIMTLSTRTHIILKLGIVANMRHFLVMFGTFMKTVLW